MQSAPRFSEDLLSSLRGRVALVGNATPQREFGNLIDQYDAVVRLNNFRLAGFEKLVGTRTDLRCTSGFVDIEHRNEHPEFSPFTADAIESAHLAAFNQTNARPVLAARMDVHPFITETPRPSTGLTLVQLTTQLGLPVDLFGFDGFKTPHYWAPNSQLHTTHSQSELEIILRRPNVILFGETYPYAALYDFCHTNHRDYDENVGLELVRRLGRTFQGKSILEFGAGNGELSRHLEAQGNRVTAVEVSTCAFEKIKCTRKIQGDAFSLASLQERFDVFASVDVLEHLTENDIRLVLREAGRLADSLFLSVSTRPSGLLGPKGENLHLTVRSADWWVEQVGRYFDVQLSNGYGTGQIVLEGRKKTNGRAPEIASRPAVQSNYCLKPEYKSRPRPQYFEDTVTEDHGVTWQPDVYPLAAQIARRLGCRRIIDVGCGHAQKLVQLQDEFDTFGIDFGSNLDYCRARYSQGQWLENDFELPDDLPVSIEDARDAVVICSDVIEHMIRPDALLRKIRGLLEHAAAAVISTPERDLTWGAEHAGPPPNPCHTREWNLAEFESLLRDARLQVEFAGVTRSHDRDPARKTILSVVGNLRGLHLSRFAGALPTDATMRAGFNRWVAELNGDCIAEPNGDAPCISVIVPTFNRPAMLVETLRSILAQSCQDFEIIVVNDAGEDVTAAIATLGDNPKIRHFRHDKNKGLAAARNTGIRAARGKYIAYLDDDDVFQSNHLQTLVEHLETTNGDVAYTDAYRAHQRKNGHTYEVFARDLPYSFDFDRSRMLENNFIPVLCFMHRKSCWEAAGGFDESLRVLEDWDLWIRMSALYRFDHIAKVTCEFRWRTDGSTMTVADNGKFQGTREIILAKRTSSPVRAPQAHEQSKVSQPKQVVAVHGFHRPQTATKPASTKLHSLSGPHRLDVFPVQSRAEFEQLYQLQLGNLLRAQEQFVPAVQKPFTLSGYCAVCDSKQEFMTDFLYATPGANGKLHPSWRERQICQCGLNSRQRACFHVLADALGLAEGALVYCTEQQGALFRTIRQRFPFTLGSEFLGDHVPLGELDMRGIRNEDLTRLTYPDDAFDCIVCLEVLEHVPNYPAALSELARCLKPGGKLLLTTPIHFNKENTIVRASFGPDGKLIHHLPPVYHGDPISADGCLCFNDFGWDLLEEIKRAGFTDAAMHFFTSAEYGYLGMQCVVLATRESVLTNRSTRRTRLHGSARRKPARVRPQKPIEGTETLLQRAESLFKASNWSEASEAYLTLSSRLPDDLPIWQARLECARQQGHAVMADLILEEALECHPEWAAALGETPGTLRQQDVPQTKPSASTQAVPVAVVVQAPPVSEGSVSDRMKREWNERAAENARYYVRSSTRDQSEEEFDSSGEQSVQQCLIQGLPEFIGNRNPQTMTMLEIGCGVGRMTKHFARNFGHVHAIDVSGEMIRQACGRLGTVANISLHETSGSDLSLFEDGKFDLVFSYIVFQHIPDRAVIFNYIREAHRVLQPGGVFRFQVQGCTQKEWMAAPKDTWHGVTITEEDVDALRAELGFDLLAKSGQGTQYSWYTLRKQIARPHHLPPVPRRETAEDLLERAAQLCATSNWVEAGEIYLSLSSNRPHDVAVWHGRIECARQQGHTVMADLLLEEAMEKHPEWAAQLGARQKTTTATLVCH